MKPTPAAPAGAPKQGTGVTRLVAGLSCLLALSGCSTFQTRNARPNWTTFESPLVILPARLIGNQMVIEIGWDRFGPYHFLIDTGSSTTLVSSDLARRYGLRDNYPADTPQVVARSSDGRTSLLPSTTLGHIELGDATFDDVPALIYDFGEMSSHLGVRIDGLLGFPLFRQSLLTLDYPNSRVVLTPATSETRQPGVAVSFNNEERIPVIPLGIGDRTFAALIDSGSDAAISLNPVGLEPGYAVAPRDAGLVETLTGTRDRHLARLDETVTLAGYALKDPIVDVIDDLSSIGGGTLKNFTVTFDQSRNQATFRHDGPIPITFDSQKSVGLAFSKTPAYWRVAAVIPGSPAAAAGVREGELITKIDGDSVSTWNIDRYEALLNSGRDVAFTFLNGREETSRTIPVYSLIP